MPQSEKPPREESLGKGGVQPVRRWWLARHIAGWGLLLVGVAGLVLPVMPGWPFLAWGAIILAPDVPFIARVLDRIAARVPALRAAIEKLRGVPGN